jgi:hypothetical protein
MSFSKCGDTAGKQTPVVAAGVHTTLSFLPRINLLLFLPAFSGLHAKHTCEAEMKFTFNEELYLNPDQKSSVGNTTSIIPPQH